MWFEIKIKYSRTDENDNRKTFNQPYLFDALSFTEAEARAVAVMQQYISEEFTITNIKIANFSEILPTDHGEQWYKCKLSCITFNEEKGSEKKENSYVLVQAVDLKDAYETLAENLKDSVSNFEIPSIALSPILDVFPYFEEENQEENQLNGANKETAPVEEEQEQHFTQKQEEKFN